MLSIKEVLNDWRQALLVGGLILVSGLLVATPFVIAGVEDKLGVLGIWFALCLLMLLLFYAIVFAIVIGGLLLRRIPTSAPYRYIRMLLSLEPGARDATMEKAYERTEGRVGKLVLRLYYAGYDPTVIARIIIAHAIEFVILCGGPDINPEPLRTARAALAELLMLEHSRRRLTPAYDAVGQYLERW